MLVELRTTASEPAPFCTKAKAGRGYGGIGVGATGRADSFSINICVSGRAAVADIQLYRIPRSRLLDQPGGHRAGFLHEGARKFITDAGACVRVRGFELGAVTRLGRPRVFIISLVKTRRENDGTLGCGSGNEMGY